MTNDLNELVGWLNRQFRAFEACGYSKRESMDKALALARAQGRLL